MFEGKRDKCENIAENFTNVSLKCVLRKRSKSANVEIIPRRLLKIMLQPVRPMLATAAFIEEEIQTQEARQFELDVGYYWIFVENTSSWTSELPGLAIIDV